MKKFLFFAVLATLAVVYSCQKDAGPTDALTASGLLAGERGDSLHQHCDSLHTDSLGGHHGHHHPFDSLHVHDDSLHIHHDSFPHWGDSTHVHEPDTTGGHHGGGHHGGGHGGGGHHGHGG